MPNPNPPSLVRRMWGAAVRIPSVLRRAKAMAAHDIAADFPTAHGPVPYLVIPSDRVSYEALVSHAAYERASFDLGDFLAAQHRASQSRTWRNYVAEVKLVFGSVGYHPPVR